MTFIWMEMLWLLLLIPLLVWAYLWLMKRRKKVSVRFASLGILQRSMGKGPGWRRHLPPALFLLAIGVLILAVARPAAVVTLSSARGTIILAMDVSGSMRGQDVEPSRMIAAQMAAKEFISSQPPNVQIGIVAFASAALLVQAPTIDREALNAAIDRFQLRRGTAVGAGILVSLSTIFPEEEFGAEDEWMNALGRPSQFTLRGQRVESRSLDTLGTLDDRPEREPVEPGSYDSAIIVLLTDGATTTGPDPIEAGKTAASYGVRVYTVGFGSVEGEIINFGGRSMRARLDADTLTNVAETTKAEYFEATSADELTTVYNSLSTKLTAEKKLTEISFIFAGIGALVALIGAGLSLLWFGRIA